MLGYSYTLEPEKIKRYMKLSTADKLIWLAEINQLTQKVLTPQERQFRQKLREASI